MEEGITDKQNNPIFSNISDLSQPTSPSIVNSLDRKRLAQINRARFAGNVAESPSLVRSRSCSPRRTLGRNVTTSSSSTPLKDDLFKQLLKRTAASSTSSHQIDDKDNLSITDVPDIQLVAEVGTSLLEYCNQLKEELAHKEDELSRIILAFKEMEQRLEISESQNCRSSQSQQTLQNRVWGLEVSNQELLDKISNQDESMVKLSQDLRSSRDQVKRLSEELEAHKVLEQSFVEKQAVALSDHEAEVISLRKHISELKREKIELSKILDDYQTKVSILEKGVLSHRSSHLSDDGIDRLSKSSLEIANNSGDFQDFNRKISSLEKDNGNLILAIQKHEIDRQELASLLSDAQETIEILKQEKENLMWRFGVNAGSPILARSRNPSNRKEFSSNVVTSAPEDSLRIALNSLSTRSDKIPLASEINHEILVKDEKIFALQSSNSILTEELEKSKEKVIELQKESLSYVESRTALMAEIAHLQQQEILSQKSLIESGDAHKLEKESILGENAALKSKIDSLLNDSRDMEDRLKSCQADLEATKRSIIALEQERDKAADDLNSTQSQLISKEAALVQEFQTLQRRENALLMENHKLQSLVQQHEEEKGKVAEQNEASIKVFTSEIASLKASLLANDEKSLEEKRSLNLIIEDWAVKYEDLESQSNLIRKQVDEKDEQIKNLMAEKGKVTEQNEASINLFTSEIASLKASLLANDEKSLEEKNSLNLIIEDWVVKYKDLESQSNLIQKQVDEKDEQIKNLISESNFVKSSFEKEIAERMKESNAVVEKLQFSLTEKDLKYFLLEKEIKDKDDIICDIQTNANALAAKMKSLEKDLEQSESLYKLELAKVSALESKVLQVSNEKNDLESKLHQVEMSLEKSRIELLEKETIYNAKLQELRQQLSARSERIVHLLEREKKLVSEIETFEAQNDQLVKEHSKAADDWKSMETTCVKEFEITKAYLAERDIELKDALVELQIHKDNFEALKVKHQEMQALFTTKEKSFQESMISLRAEKEDLKLRIEAVKVKAEEEFQDAKVELSKEADKLRERLTVKMEKIELLELKVCESEEALKKTESLLNEKVNLESMLLHQTETINQLEEEVKIYKETIEDLRKKNSDFVVASARKDVFIPETDSKILSPMISSPQSFRTDALSSRVKNDANLFNLDSIDEGSNFDCSFAEIPFPQNQSMTVFGEIGVTDNITQMLSGCWMYKYPRKSNDKLRGVEFLNLKKLHRRYFWVNPFSMVVSWSEQEASSSTFSKSARIYGFCVEKKKLPKMKSSIKATLFSGIQKDNGEDDLSQVDISQILEKEATGEQVVKESPYEDQDTRDVNVIVVFTRELGGSGGNKSQRKEQLCLIPIKKSDFEVWTKGLEALIDHYRKYIRNSRNPFPNMNLVLEENK